MNNDLPNLGLESSHWGMFFMDTPYPIDKNICEKMKVYQFKNIPLEIQKEFYKNCITAISINSKNDFFWSQEKMNRYIIVKDTKHKLSSVSIAKLPLKKSVKREMIDWINEWNKSKPDDRLVNYSSIPIFTSDKQFVMIIRGQDVENEGGWDTIFIYKWNGTKWEIAEKIIVTTI